MLESKTTPLLHVGDSSSPTERVLLCQDPPPTGNIPKWAIPVVKQQRLQALSLSTAPHPLNLIIRFGSAESDNQAGKYHLSPKASQAAFRARQQKAK
jgi:hypothetical protein